MEIPDFIPFRAASAVKIFPHRKRWPKKKKEVLHLCRAAIFNHYTRAHWCTANGPQVWHGSLGHSGWKLLLQHKAPPSRPLPVISSRVCNAVKQKQCGCHFHSSLSTSLWKQAGCYQNHVSTRTSALAHSHEHTGSPSHCWKRGDVSNSARLPCVVPSSSLLLRVSRNCIIDGQLEKPAPPGGEDFLSKQ